MHSDPIDVKHLFGSLLSQIKRLDKFFVLAGFLLIFDLLFMTRFYALANVCEALLFSLFIFHGNLRRQLLLEMKSNVAIPLFFFLLWVAVSGIWSSADLSSKILDVLDWRKMFLFPIALVIFRNNLFRVLGVSMVVSIGVLFLILGLGGLAFDTDVWSRAPHSVLQNYSAQGFYFSVVGLVLFNLGCLSRDLSRLFRALTICLGLVFILFVVFTSPSRGAYLGFAINMTLLCYVLFRGKFSGLVIGVAVSVFLIYASPVSQSRLTQAVNELSDGFSVKHLDKSAAEVDQASGSLRMIFWLNTIDMIIANPVFGTGAAGFSDGYAALVASDVGWTALVTDDPHSQYLHIAAEYGLVGVLLFIWFLFSLLREADAKTVWGICLLSVILVASSMSLIVGAFGAFIEGRIAILLMGLFLAFKRHESPTAIHGDKELK